MSSHIEGKVEMKRILLVAAVAAAGIANANAVAIISGMLTLPIHCADGLVQDIHIAARIFVK